MRSNPLASAYNAEHARRLAYEPVLLAAVRWRFAREAFLHPGRTRVFTDALRGALGYAEKALLDALDRLPEEYRPETGELVTAAAEETML